MKQKVITILFLIIIFSVCIVSFVIKDSKISYFERRILQQFPQPDEDFTKNLDSYFLDQFPIREKFILLNSNVSRNILNIKDYNNVYIVDDNIYEVNNKLNKNQCINFCHKVNYIVNNYCKNSNVYYSVIPDKSYFLDENKYLKLDYNSMYNILEGNISGKYIDIKNSLDIADYYKTDIHIKQENVYKIIEELVENMGYEYQNIEYIKKEYNNFYGSLYSKAGTKMEPDNLVYLYSSYMDDIIVNHLEYGNKEIYDEEKLNGIDSYNVFLSGASSYIEIINSNPYNNKELIIFRDSFASNIAPLLIPYYSKITLIDLRYIDFDIARQKIDMNNKDILFIYSTNIVNNSSILKIN